MQAKCTARTLHLKLLEGNYGETHQKRSDDIELKMLICSF